MAVITVSRGFGTGGEDIARRIADRLGIRYLDREITSSLASQAGVSEDTLLEASRRPSLLTRMAELLARYPMDDLLCWSVAGMPPAPAWNHESYRKLVDEFIRGVAAKGDAVIVGHGAQATLKDCDRALRCFIWAPMEYRVQHTMLSEGVDRRGAERLVNYWDREWRVWLQSQYGIDWISMLNYDLVLNVGRIGHDAAVAAILDSAASIDQLARW